MCHFPRLINNPLADEKKLAHRDYRNKIWVPCNNCSRCFTTRSNAWYFRLHYEMQRAVNSSFVTLTYAEAPITKSGKLTCVKEDLQNYFKRLRQRELPNKSIKYYAASEYGEESHRPHYHIILFNTMITTNIYDAWSINDKILGIVDVRPVIPQRINYVTGYIGKKIGIDKKTDDRQEEFSLMSKGIGTNYLDKAADFNRRNLEGYSHIDGIPYVLPRYIREKIFPSENGIQHESNYLISKKNYERFNETQDKQRLAFNSDVDWAKNKRETALRDQEKQRIITKNSI